MNQSKIDASRPDSEGEHNALDNATARGKRVRLLRESLQLSISKFAAKYNIKRTTFTTWELGRFSGLTHKGALILVDAFKKEGLLTVSVEWLLWGKGVDPLSASNLVTAHSNNREKIIQELQYFHQLHSNAIDAIIQSDALEPCFSRYDLVAGIRQFNDEMGKLAGHMCIVQLQSGEINVGKLIKGDKPDHYTLMNINPKTTKKIIQKNVKLFSAARIVWHRRVD